MISRPLKLSGFHSRRRWSPQKPLLQKLLCQFVDVALVAGLPLAERDDHDDDFPPLDAVYDAVTLTDGANGAEAGQLSDNGLPCCSGDLASWSTR